MGVFGLAAFLVRVKSLWEEIELKNTKVIVDGNALLYHLYFQDSVKLDGRRGGQYKQFHDKIVEFFRRLLENGVEPYVLLDGAFDLRSNKLRTSEERMQAKIRGLAKSDPGVQILPPLARRTFIQTIKNISGVQFAVCDL